MIEERFKFCEFEKTLLDLSSRQIKNFFSSWKRKGISEKNVIIVITLIREEAGHFNVDITDYFEN